MTAFFICVANTGSDRRNTSFPPIKCIVQSFLKPASFCMKSVVLFIVVFCIGWIWIPDSYAQSRRVPPTKTAKPNERPPGLPAPTPTPAETPEPQATDNAPDSGEVVSVDTRLVTIPVRVMDRRGRFIGGLTQQSFKVYEDEA